MIQNRFSLLFICGLLSLASCQYFSQKNTDKQGKVLAKVGDKKLYESDILHLTEKSLDSLDSANAVNTYISTWIRETLLLEKAELNLTDEMKNFEQQLEEYRKSLLIYAYQDKFVERNLDTHVTSAQIRDYYNVNKDNFGLRQNIVKAQYLVFFSKNKQADKIKKWWKSNDDKDIKKIKKFARDEAFKYNFNDSTWIQFEELEKIIPLKYNSQEQFLSSGKYFEFQDSTITYLLQINDYKVKNTLSPLAFEKDRIRSIIINTRKLELVKKMEQELYDQAIQDKHAVILQPE